MKSFSARHFKVKCQSIVRNEIRLLGCMDIKVVKILRRMIFIRWWRLFSNRAINVHDLISKRASFANIRRDLISECIGKVNGISDHVVPVFARKIKQLNKLNF